MEKNVYRGNETGVIKASNPPKQKPNATTVVGGDLRGKGTKGGKK